VDSCIFGCGGEEGRGFGSHLGQVKVKALQWKLVGLGLGQRVRHGKFGDGVVLNLEGSGSHARVQVNFEHTGSKWLVVAYANLECL
jgi:DNA helicase-2/ATP-dependent DNA helicase PcrA